MPPIFLAQQMTEILTTLITFHKRSPCKKIRSLMHFQTTELPLSSGIEVLPQEGAYARTASGSIPFIILTRFIKLRCRA